MSAIPHEDAVSKVCCRCGKDVNGQRRLRDDRGYWCYDCHQADKIAKNPPTAPCADCGRVIPEAGLIDYDGDLVCRSCHEDRRTKRKYSPVSLHAHHKEDRRRLLVLAGIALLLLAIIILRKMGILADLW